MNIKLIGLIPILVLTLGIATTANAGLIDRGNGMIYDSDLDITWMADANYAQTSGYDSDGLMAWAAAMSWADSLSFGGYNDWRLFSSAPDDTDCSRSFTPSGYATQYYGYECIENELGHLFYDELEVEEGESILDSSETDFLDLFSNIQEGYYWSDTAYAPNANAAWSFDTYYGYQGIRHKSNELYAWAVRSGDVAVTITAISEPTAFLLLATGLIGFMGIKRRRC